MKGLVDLTLRTCAALALSVFAHRAATLMAVKPSLTLGLLTLGEVVTVAMVLASRPPIGRATDLLSVLSTLAATFFFLFVVLDGGTTLVPEVLTASMQVAGITWQIWAKYTLGRSFGLLPANRGIVTCGPYRFVRHPIYLGYFVSHIGFLLADFTLRNLALLSAVYLFQGIRIYKEEAFLRRSPEYSNYCSQVRYRFLPGII